MTAARPRVELLEKNKPRQERAKRTYEAILAAAAELLVEVGIERISTNLVAERAGITVPALYRYFPNKYAVLNALGAALTEKQNVEFNQWLERNMNGGEPQLLVDNVYDLLLRTYEVIREQTGGLEILLALRAVAPLQEGRLASHRIIAEQFAEMLGTHLQRPVDVTVITVARLTIETGYAIVEMALEDETLDTQQFLREGSTMVQRYWQGILQRD